MEDQTTQEASQELNLSEMSADELKEYADRLQKERDKLKVAYAESTAEGQKLSWIDKVNRDPKEFVKLYESDKKLAGKVASHFNSVSGDNLTAEEYYNIQAGNKTSVDTSSANIDEILDKRDAKRRYKELLSEKGLDKLSKDSDFLDEFSKKYDEFMDGRKMTPSNVEKYFGVALRETKQISKHEEEYKKVIGSVQGIGSTTKGSTTKEPVKYSQLFKRRTFDDFLEGK